MRLVEKRASFRVDTQCERGDCMAHSISFTKVSLRIASGSALALPFAPYMPAERNCGRDSTKNALASSGLWPGVSKNCMGREGTDRTCCYGDCRPVIADVDITAAGCPAGCTDATVRLLCVRLCP